MNLRGPTATLIRRGRCGNLKVITTDQKGQLTKWVFPWCHWARQSHVRILKGDGPLALVSTKSLVRNMYYVRGFPERGGRLVRATEERVVLLCDDTSGRTRRVQISHVLSERHKSRLSERAPAHDACFGAMQISQLLAPVIISLTWRYVFGPPSPCERASRAEGLARATHKTKKKGN